jgi:hypothetical protein
LPTPATQTGLLPTINSIRVDATDNSGVTLLTDSSVTAKQWDINQLRFNGSGIKPQQVRLLREPIVLI